MFFLILKFFFVIESQYFRNKLVFIIIFKSISTFSFYFNVDILRFLLKLFNFLYFKNFSYIFQHFFVLLNIVGV